MSFEFHSLLTMAPTSHMFPDLYFILFLLSMQRFDLICARRVRPEAVGNLRDITARKIYDGLKSTDISCHGCVFHTLGFFVSFLPLFFRLRNL